MRDREKWGEGEEERDASSNSFLFKKTLGYPIFFYIYNYSVFILKLLFELQISSPKLGLAFLFCVLCSVMNNFLNLM